MRTLGIDLGGTKIAAAVVEEGRILMESIVPTPQTGFEDVLKAMTTVARGLLEDFPDIEAVGVGSPGPLDLKEGMVLFAPNIPGMENAPIVTGLTEKLKKRVVLENDANAAGYAEHLYGAAKDLDSSIFITISTGIGGGLFIGDQVIHGAHGIAGEIGHMTMQLHGPLDGDGHYGTLESIAAGRAIARDASYSYGQTMDTREVFRRAQNDEAKALKIIDNAALFTGIGIANLHKIYNPEGFVIGGGMSQVGSFYLDKIQAATDLYTEGYPPVTLREAKLSTEAGVIGAASVAL